MNLSHLWDSIFFSIDPAKFSSSLPLSLSHSFHHAMKKKKEEGKLLKRKKRVGNARKANENVNQISHLCYLPPPPFHLPSTPNLPPSSGYSSFLSFLFLLDHPPLLIYMHMHNHRHHHNFQLCIRGREHNESARHGSIVRARALPQLRLYRNNVGTKSLLCRHTNPARRFTTKFH